MEVGGAKLRNYIKLEAKQKITPEQNFLLCETMTALVKQERAEELDEARKLLMEQFFEINRITDEI